MIKRLTTMTAVLTVGSVMAVGGVANGSLPQATTRRPITRRPIIQSPLRP